MAFESETFTISVGKGQHINADSEMKFDRNGLLKTVLEQFRISRTGVHGPNHWARV